MKIISLCIILFFSFKGLCQEWTWTNIYYSDTTNSNAWASVNASVVDTDGNIYTVGEFGGGMTIDTIYYRVSVVSRQFFYPTFYYKEL